MLVWRNVALLPLVLMVLSPVFAGTPGIFQGRVYRDEHSGPGWIYVQGRNGALRKVEVSRARVVYADSVPAGERAGDPSVDLVQGAEVQVTAEQDGAGEWRASRVEILKVFHRPDQKPPRSAGRRNFDREIGFYPVERCGRPIF